MLYTLKKPTVFEQRIDELCARHGQSYTSLGTAAGLSHNTVRNWLDASRRGNAAPGRMKELRKLAEHWHVTVAWLTGESDESAPQSAPVPALASATDSDARWRALVELTDVDGYDAARAVDAIKRIGAGASWGDYYSAAKQLLKEGAPHVTTQGRTVVVSQASPADTASALRRLSPKIGEDRSEQSRPSDHPPRTNKKAR